ncbi:MAG: hypothetical protein ACLGIB_06085 [Actinomycetota bacterium]
MSSSRIVIDPEGVRRLATRMREGASAFSDSGRRLAQAPTPPMPVGIAARLGQAISEANAALQDLAVDLIEDAAHLEARATWAELGGGADTAWLIPGLRRYASLPSMPATPVGETAAISEDRIRGAQRWAIETLDAMPDPGSALGDEVGAVIDRGVVDAIEAFADEMPVTALGGFTLAAAAAPDVAEPWIEGSLDAGSNAGSGALGSGLRMLFSSPTGWGVAGCALAGGMDGSSGGDDAGDGALDE